MLTKNPWASQAKALSSFYFSAHLLGQPRIVAQDYETGGSAQHYDQRKFVTCIPVVRFGDNDFQLS